MYTRVTDRALRRMGVRAAAYVTDHQIRTDGDAILVADRSDTPDGVARTLTRIYGRPNTIDRGEIAYWEIGGDDVEIDE